jgi:hypothetical protein
VEFESDCANLVQMTVGLGMDRSVILAVVMDIKDIMGRRSSTLVRKIWREQNRIAHNLANYALKSRSSRVSFSIVPLCIRDLVLNDRYHCRFRSILLNKDGFLLKKITHWVLTCILSLGSISKGSEVFGWVKKSSSVTMSKHRCKARPRSFLQGYGATV